MKKGLSWARRRGTGLVEMAIVLPLLLMLVLGGLDFAFQLHVVHCMANAAREGARNLAVRGGTVDEATSAAMGQLSGIDATFTVTPTIEVNDVIVLISVPRDQVSMGISGLLGLSQGETLQVQTTMRQEQ